MPKSAIAMATVDGDYFFDINDYLIGAYPDMDLPTRKAVCNLVRSQIDEQVVIDEIDAVVLNYALDRVGWRPEEDDDDSE